MATFNIHAAVDGWSRPFDPMPGCRALDADVLVLQEVFEPEREPGFLDRLVQELGYRALFQPMGRALLPPPREDAGHGWGPTVTARGRRSPFVTGDRGSTSRLLARSPRFSRARTGRIGLALLTRLPLLGHELVDLGRGRHDPAHRWAIVVHLGVGDETCRAGTLTVIGTHMAHVHQGSIRRLRMLRRAVEPATPGEPMVLTGDMNLWGPPLTLMLPGWRRAVRGATWPARGVHSQLDHVFVRGPVQVLEAGVRPDAGSDHRPVAVTLRLLQ